MRGFDDPAFCFHCFFWPEVEIWGHRLAEYVQSSHTDSLRWYNCAALLFPRRMHSCGVWQACCCHTAAAQIDAENELLRFTSGLSQAFKLRMLIACAHTVEQPLSRSCILKSLCPGRSSLSQHHFPSRNACMSTSLPKTLFLQLVLCANEKPPRTQIWHKIASLITNLVSFII